MNRGASGADENSELIVGSAAARSNNPDVPPASEKVMATPSTMNATSLTRLSAATDRMRPFWCSVASACRVPNSMAKIAMAMAMNIGMSPNGVSSLLVSTPSGASTPSDSATAFSWREM